MSEQAVHIRFHLLY